jgi:nitrogen regulatory protein PII
MKFVVAIIQPSQIRDGKIFVHDLQSAVRIRAGKTDAGAISEPAPSTLWTGATP